jgi:DNA-binding winged helix-turn-helix (wHTH) protein/TolB-like protein
MGLKVPESFMDKRFYTFDSFCLDPAERGLFRGEDRVPLAHAHFDVLLMLVQRAGEDVTKEELWKVWGNGRGNDALLNTAIHKVREALGDDTKPRRYIVTVPNKGYRFLAKVELCQDRPSALGSSSPTLAPSKEASSNNQKLANDPPAARSVETWGEWLTGGIWRDLKEGANLIKDGFDTLIDALFDAGSILLKGFADGGREILRGFRRWWLPLIFIAAVVLLGVWLLSRLRHPLITWILVIMLWLIVLVIYLRRRSRPAIRKVRSIAVLPFKNQNCPANRQDFAQGLTNAVISKLTQLEFLRIRQASVSGSENILGIIKRLRMGAVLTGHVDWSGDLVCVTGMLFKWDGKTVLWGEQFEEKFLSNSTTQNTIAQRLVDQLAASLRKKAGNR